MSHYNQELKEHKLVGFRIYSVVKIVFSILLSWKLTIIILDSNWIFYNLFYIKSNRRKRDRELISSVTSLSRGTNSE